ncbi:MAG: hypothetical protein J6K29_09005 [Clostridia bacterium]|nr:hypothetical protein [Clostridia bacterium]
MAKKKRKRSSRTSSLRPAPPLSRLDKGIYLLLAVLAFCITFSPLIAALLLEERVAFSDPTVIGSTRPGRFGLWMLLSMIVSGVPLASVLACGLATRQPFFGRKDVFYGFRGGRTEIYPLFRKRETPLKPVQKRERGLIAALVAVALLVPVLLSVLSVYGRADLHEDLSVTVKNGFNAETKRMEAEEIETVTFSIERYRGRRGIIGSLSAHVILTMENGRKYSFTPDADTMLYIKSRVSPSMIRYEMEGSVEEYIDRHIRDPIEADKLRAVFAEA